MLSKDLLQQFEDNITRFDENIHAFENGEIDILTLLLKSGLVPSKSEARRAVQQGGVAADGEKVADIHAVFTKDALSGEGIVLKKGKKNFRKVVVK